MTSLVRAPAQIPSLYGYFRVDNPLTDLSSNFIVDPIKFTVGTGGVVLIQGTNIFFDSYQSVVSFLGNPTAYNNSKTTLADGDLLRDMGKTYTFYVQTNVNNEYVNNLKTSIHVVTLTKVQKYLSPGEVSEGVTGKVISTAIPPASGSAYQTGYVVTWTANPSQYNGANLANSGVPVNVVRTGYE